MLSVLWSWGTVTAVNPLVGAGIYFAHPENTFSSVSPAHVYIVADSDITSTSFSVSLLHKPTVELTA